MSTPDPTPPPRIEGATLAALMVFGGLALAALAALMPGTMIEYYALRLWLPLWLIAALVHGGALLAVRSRWVTRITRRSRHSLVEYGGGAYAAIALTCFLWLEWGQLQEAIEWTLAQDWHDAGAVVRSAVRSAAQGVVGFLAGSFQNGFYALVWPAFWKNIFTAGQMWPAAIVGWAVFDGARYAVNKLARPQ